MLNEGAYQNPPYDVASLTACLTASFKFINNIHTLWNPDRMGLYFRTLCLLPNLEQLEFDAVAKILNFATMLPLDPIQRPDLWKRTDFARRASVAAIVFYREPGDVSTNAQTSLMSVACNYYQQEVMLKAEKSDANDTVEDLRLLASSCCLVCEYVFVPHHDWPVLIADDVRWCLVAGKDDWPMLMDTYPQTREYLAPFSILCELVSPIEALRHVWYTQNPMELLTQPDFDFSSV